MQEPCNMEDACQDAVSSPSTPGTGKSKLDTLPKEDLIKFAKKQVVILQKVKSRCTELEKEVQELKFKQSAVGNEDVIQALTDRLDAVLLEKAEAQQQLVSLKKENGKIKQEAKDAIEKTVKLQEQLEQSTKDFFKEIESLKNELETLTLKHNEDACRMQQKLKVSADKQMVLTDQLAIQSNREDDIKRLQEELQHLRPTYEEQILHLNQQLEAIAEEKTREKKILEEVQKDALECHRRQVHNLKEELLKLKSAHHEEVSDLVHQLETHGKEYEEERKKINQLMQDIAEEYLAKENSLQEELLGNKVKYEQELILLREALDENKDSFKGNTDGQNNSSLESEKEEKVKHFDCILKEYESQQSILKDELTYTRNVKLKLEMEVKHLKEEFFHEREELEFKVNELQLAKEDYSCVTDKLKAQLQGTNDHCEAMVNRYSEEVQMLRDQHKKDILDLKAALISSSEQEKSSLVFEIKILKEQCERLLQEKEEAVSNYESLRETLVTLQDELGESAVKISREFKAMKEQQATDVQELQQKLRIAYNEKDVLLETVNRLKVEVEGLSSNQDECEELRQKLSNLQALNGEMVVSLQQKDASLKELEEKMNNLGFQQSDVLITLETSSQELHKLQEMCEREQAHALALQHKIEALTKDNTELKQHCEEWIEKLKEAQTEKDQSYQKCAEFEKQIEAFVQEKERLSSNAEALNDEVVKLKEERDTLTRDMERLMSEREGSLVIKEQIENLQNKLHLVTVEKEELGKLYEKDQQQKLLNEEKLLSEVQALHVEVGRLREENNMMTRDIERFVAERDGSLVVKEQVENLQNKLLLAVEEKEELSKLVKKDQQQKLLIESRLTGLIEQMDGRQLDETQENNMITIVQAVEESVVRLKEENQGMVLQNNERCLLLQQDIERLQEENEVQCAELRSLIEDYAKEKMLLRTELEATLSEKEALQRDLLEMKTANEKTRMENLDLLGHIEEVTKKLESSESQTKQQLEQPPEAVQENLEGLLEQKESDLCNLKAEFMFLKDSVDKSSAVESDQQAAITKLQAKMVNLEKVSKEREERLNKIKAVAVKAKKELDSSRKEVQTLKEELESMRSEKNQLSASLKDLIQGAENYKNLLVEYDKQAEQLDIAKERAEYSERQIEELTRQLQAAYQQLDQFNSDKEDLLVRVDTLQTNTRLLETQILEMQRARSCVDKELEAEKLLKEQKIKDHTGALKQLEDLQTQLQKEKKQLQNTMHELELVRKDAQKSTLMDMEMADYERLVKELNQKISEKNSSLEDLEQEIRLKQQREETLEEEITSLQASVEQYEERSTKMKQLLVKTKKELADSKQAETDQLLLQASLKGELEASQQQGESFKIQVAELTAEKHRVQEQLRTFMEQQQRTTSAYQQKIATLQDAYSIAKADQAAVTAEFEGYKVRVHNVFKQQKNKSSSHIENEAVRQEREHMEMMLEQLKTKLQDTQHNLQINMTELQTLQADHDTLLERHNKMLQETVGKEAELREKLCTVQSENMVMKSEHAQILSQLTAQNEALRNSFRDQVRHMQEDHRKTMETLQQQLSKVEGQLFQQKSESSITSPSSSQQQMKTLRERRATDVPLLDMYIAAREEGEGMETTDTESVSSASTYIPPLDQLLNSPETKFEPPQWQPELSKEELVQKLNTTTKGIDHLSGLLHETEATNAILMEQITLLKNEVRRLERNQEREKSINNLEYLKNVLLQFIFLKAGSERQRLLPVIDTMLHLSPEEKGKLVAIALGEEEAAARPAGWGSYLHSWSALR